MLFDNNRKEITQFDISVLSLLLSGRRKMKLPVISKKRYAPDGYVYQNKRMYGHDGYDVGYTFDVYYSQTENKFYITTDLDPDISITTQTVNRTALYNNQSIGQYLEKLYDYKQSGLVLWGGNGQSGFNWAYAQFDDFAGDNLPYDYKTDWIIQLKGRYKGAYSGKTNRENVVCYQNYDTNEAYYTTYISYFALNEPTRTITKNNVENYIYEITDLAEASYNYFNLDIDYNEDEESYLAFQNVEELWEWYWYDSGNLKNNYKLKQKILIEKLKKKIKSLDIKNKKKK